MSFHLRILFVAPTYRFRLMQRAHLWQVVQAAHGDDLFGDLEGGVALGVAHKVLRHSFKDRLGAALHVHAVVHDGGDQLRIAASQPP